MRRIHGKTEGRLPIVACGGVASVEDAQAKLDAGASLTWNVTPLTTVVGGVRRTVEETTSAGSGGYFGTEVSLSVDHELLRNLVLGVDGRYVMRDYDGIDRNDDYYELGFDALYMVNRDIYLSAGYEYRDRSSNADGETYNQHVAMVLVDREAGILGHRGGDRLAHPAFGREQCDSDRLLGGAHSLLLSEGVPAGPARRPGPGSWRR